MTTTATTSGATRARAVSPVPSSTPKPDSLAAALAILQTRLPHIGKDRSANIKPGFSYRYADLAVISKALLPVMGELGLSFSALPTLAENGQLVMDYALRHVSGEQIDGRYPLPASGTPQQIGSAITYARRYCLCAVTGVAADEDDDDAAAAEAGAKPKAKGAGRGASAELKGAALREHNALRREGERHDGKLETGIKDPDPADPWASVDANGERQPPGDLPVTYPPGDRQFRALHMHFKRLGYDHDHETPEEREERLMFLAALAGAGEISSSKELTQEQVKLALGRAEKLKDRTALVDAVEELKQSEAAGA